MRLRGLLAVGMVLGLAAAAAAAEQKEAKAEDPLKGVYLQLGVLASLEAFDLTTEFNPRDSWGMDARAGYRFHPHLAAEADFQWAHDFDIGAGGVNVGNVESYTFTLNGKVYAFDGPFTPYAVVGAGFQHAKTEGSAGADDKTEFAFRVGGGFEVRVWEGLGGYAELAYLQPATSLGDFAQVPISFGVKYEFR